MGDYKNEFGTEYVKVPGTGVAYKNDITIGTTNRKYTNMTEKQRTQHYEKTSQVLNYLRTVGDEEKDILNKLGELTRICELNKVALRIVERIDYHIYNENMMLAEEIYRTQFLKLKYCSIKGALSPREIHKMLEDGKKIASFRKELPNIINTIESGRKTIGMLKSIYESFGQVRVLIETHNDETPFSSEYLSENPFAEARRQRNGFKEVKQKMNVLMDICGELAAGAPTGMKEYIEFNLAAFKAADKAVTIVDQYAEKIEDALIDIDKLFQENFQTKSITTGSSIILSKDSMKRGHEQDLNRQLDGFFR